MKIQICGACERELPDGAYSGKQRELRQSSRRCEECVAAGNQLVLMKKGSTKSEEDDCPICQLPLPVDAKQYMFKTCCMKIVCNGCILTRKRGMRDCPFCRTPRPGESQFLAMVRKRVDAGDPVAICFLGTNYEQGLYDLLKKDAKRAAELYERAAKLGVKGAHYNLGCLYAQGTDVEKDMAKAFRHYEMAAMCGHVAARHNLGCMEEDAGNYDLALQHWMISASLGLEQSLNNVKSFFENGLASKADYAAALSGYQNANNKLSSPDRDEATLLGLNAIKKI